MPLVEVEKERRKRKLRLLENGELIDKKVLKKVDDYKVNKTSDDIDSYFQRDGLKPKRKR